MSQLLEMSMSVLVDGYERLTFCGRALRGITYNYMAQRHQERQSIAMCQWLSKEAVAGDEARRALHLFGRQLSPPSTTTDSIRQQDIH